MKNKIANGDSVKITGPTGGLSSGDPYVVGGVALVASTDIAEGATGAAERRGIFDLPVAAIDSSGDAGADADKAVAAGDSIYYDASDDPVLSKRAGGTLYGYAWGAVTAGATATIPVILAE